MLAAGLSRGRLRPRLSGSPGPDRPPSEVAVCEGRLPEIPVVTLGSAHDQRLDGARPYE